MKDVYKNRSNTKVLAYQISIESFPELSKTYGVDPVYHQDTKELIGIVFSQGSRVVYGFMDSWLVVYPDDKYQVYPDDHFLNKFHPIH